ncbi:MAG: LD-carboxypeptidase [Thermodesulfobacteriota bacterium]
MEKRIFTATRPPALLPGDTVGLAAPASCFDRLLFEKGLTVLSGLGFSVRVPEAVFRRNGYLAGTDAQRAEALSELWQDPEVKAVFCVRGGYGTMRILPLLDFGMIAQNPKVFVGFSDITALLVNFVARSGLCVFHGPVLTSLAHNAADPELEAAGIAAALDPDKPLRLVAEKPEVLAPGRAEGPVLGGNLTILSHLAGTPYFPDLTGAILFLEDTAEAPYRVDRMLTHLFLAGLLDKVSGVALGDFCDCGDKEAIHRVVAAAFAERGVPVVGGFAVGHGARNLCLPLGISAELSADDAALSFRQPATEGPG